MKILKHENVYVVVDNYLREEFTPEEVNELVYDYDSNVNRILYGGRVHLSYSNGDFAEMKVDGISICEIGFEEKVGFTLDDRIAIEKITAFLNQIENLGVDTFLENYKKRLQDLKTEVESMVSNIEQEHTDQQEKSNLVSLKNFIGKITCIIFALLVNMNAGLDNQSYIDAYNNIVNLYFE